MSKAAKLLLQNLELSPEQPGIFSGPDDEFQLPNPYGGRLIGQAISAAGACVDGHRQLHSMHAYFMRSGQRDLPIQYKVSALRDGGNFSTRQVDAVQRERVLFSGLFSFHTFEENVAEQLARMPKVPPPESLGERAWQELSSLKWLTKLGETHPLRSFDLRFVPGDHPAGQPERPDKRQLWMKLRGDRPGQRSNEAVFGWFSDFFLLPTVLKSLGVQLGSSNLRIASLDHSLWIHQNLDLSQWLLFDYRCTGYSHSRAHTEAKIYNRDGLLVASLAQEGLVQIKTPTQ